MSRLEVRAELLKLARLLGREAEQLAYLEGLAEHELRELREQVTEVLFSSHDGALRRLAAASRLLPVGLVAQLAERSFGPVLSARVTGLIEPDRAVEISERLPTSFLADIAVELDPRRAREVIARIPPRQIAAVTRELTRRREYVTMGRFVGHLPDGSLKAAIDAMDTTALLEVALVLENKDRLPDVMGLLPPARLDEMAALAADSDMEQELLALVDHMSPAQRTLVTRAPALQRRRSA